MAHNKARKLAVAFGVPVLALLACSRGEDRGYGGRSTVTVSTRIGAEALNPSADTWSKFLVFLPLVTVSETGELEGRLARSWEHSRDFREWTYHLRTDVRWHDGVPVTARDVKFTLDLLSNPAALYFGPDYFESITVIDDSTVTIRSIDFALEWASWIVFFPEHLLKHLDPGRLYDWDFWMHPVGNGPYRFVRYLPETSMEFAANPDYFRGSPRIGRVLLKFDPEGRLSELLSGNVDAIATANPSERPKLAEDPRFRAYQSPDGLVRVLYWKNDHPLFQDPRVRRALTLAVNRTELQRLLGIPETIPVVDGVLAPERLLRADVPPPLPYDPVQAGGLLAEAGWVDHVGGRVREREGTPFHFALLVPGGSGTAGIWQRAAVFVQEQYRRVGVRMDIKLLDHAVVTERLRRGNFEAVLTFSAGMNWLEETFGRGSPLGYRNGKVDELLARLRSTANPEERDSIHREFIRIFQAEAPVTFLGPVAWTSFVHRRLRGLRTPFRANPLQFMDDLWLEDGN